MGRKVVVTGRLALPKLAGLNGADVLFSLMPRDRGEWRKWYKTRVDSGVIGIYHPMRTRTEYERAKVLLDSGHNQCQVARETGIPRGTIKDWVTRGFCPKNDGKGGGLIMDAAAYVSETEERRAAYAFVLGEYLGDGCVRLFRGGTMFRLGIYNDKKYEGLNQLIENRMQRVLPLNKVTRSSHGLNCWEIYVYSRSIPQLFPQMGPGRKHARKIELLPWQLEIVNAYPKEFVKGLFYSDGCIYDHKHDDGRYVYLSYAFTNKSRDIAEYLCYALRAICIDKQPRWAADREIYVISNFRKPDRAILATFLQRKHEITVE